MYNMLLYIISNIILLIMHNNRLLLHMDNYSNEAVDCFVWIMMKQCLMLHMHNSRSYVIIHNKQLLYIISSLPQCMNNYKLFLFAESISFSLLVSIILSITYWCLNFWHHIKIWHIIPFCKKGIIIIISLIYSLNRLFLLEFLTSQVLCHAIPSWTLNLAPVLSGLPR